jgi:hypothetical protein
MVTTTHDEHELMMTGQGHEDRDRDDKHGGIFFFFSFFKCFFLLLDYYEIRVLKSISRNQKKPKPNRTRTGS